MTTQRVNILRTVRLISQKGDTNFGPFYTIFIPVRIFAIPTDILACTTNWVIRAVMVLVVVRTSIYVAV